MEHPETTAQDISIVLCGAAGQGIKTVEKLLVHALKRSNYNVFASREYMSRVRGGNNSTEIRVGSHPVRALVDRIDILIALNPGIRPNIQARLADNTLILGDREELGDEFENRPGRFMNMELLDMAKKVGGKIYANVVAAGIVFGMLKVDEEILGSMFSELFSSKGEDVVRKNIEAAWMGYSKGQALLAEGVVSFSISPDGSLKDHIALDGSEAVSLGAIAGGCNLIASYPMSPATGVLTFLAQHSRDFGIVAEQIEDEIAAMNMAVGGGYAGARAMVSTSGGGFALMSEGLSLAGVMEIPVVVHLGQRPGPATGMATRTEQGDLELAVYSGHGEFPRIVLAPSCIEDAFELTSKAFYLADKFQTQVILLTDQYFLNTFYNVPAFDLNNIDSRPLLVDAHKGYRRYENTGSGISPRAVPGSGPEIVGADSHEHDEWGHVKEDFELRTRMVDKRLRKLKAMSEESVEPLFSSQGDYEILVISWGSTYPMVREALDVIESRDVAHLHIRQIHPLSEDILKYMAKASKRIIIEGNATGQMEKHLKLHTGFAVDERVLNYRGLQFSVEDIREALERLLH